VALDHPLGSKEALDLLPHLGDMVTLLEIVWSLGTKAEALQAKTDTGLARTLGVLHLIAFLATDPTRVAPRLGPRSALSLGRPKFLVCDFCRSH